VSIDPSKLNQPTVPDSAKTALVDADRDHVAQVEIPAEQNLGLLHLGAGDETVCGQARAGLEVTDHASVFELARTGKLTSHRHVCPACDAARPGGGYRG
jgi:hypothetical protein